MTKISQREVMKRYRVSTKQLKEAVARGELTAEQGERSYPVILYKEEEAEKVFSTKGLISVSEYAKEHGLSRETVYSRIRQGIIPSTTKRRKTYVIQE